MSDSDNEASGNLRRLGNVHHAAFRCRDAEQTRWFYEEVLGLPLAAAMVFDALPGTGKKSQYMHLFFELGDGNFIAFFDEPESAAPEQFLRKDSFDVHIALEVESHEALLAWQARINAAGKTCLGPVDHDFVKSVYMYDPNGLQVEITCKSADYDEIMAADAASAQHHLTQWTSMTRADKEARFGAEALDMRGR